MSNERNKALSKIKKSKNLTLELTLAQAESLNYHLMGLHFEHSPRQKKDVKHAQNILAELIKVAQKEASLELMRDPKNAEPKRSELLITKDLSDVLFSISHGKWPQKKGNYQERLEWLGGQLEMAAKLSSGASAMAAEQIKNLHPALISLKEKYPNNPQAVIDAIRTTVRKVIQSTLR